MEHLHAVNNEQREQGVALPILADPEDLFGSLRWTTNLDAISSEFD